MGSILEKCACVRILRDEFHLNHECTVTSHPRSAQTVRISLCLPVLLTPQSPESLTARTTSFWTACIRGIFLSPVNLCIFKAFPYSLFILVYCWPVEKTQRAEEQASDRSFRLVLNYSPQTGRGGWHWQKWRIMTSFWINSHRPASVD